MTVNRRARGSSAPNGMEVLSRIYRTGGISPCISAERGTRCAAAGALGAKGILMSLSKRTTGALLIAHLRAEGLD